MVPNTMAAKLSCWAVIAAGILLAGSSFAQNPSSQPPAASAPSGEEEGKDIGDFHVTQSVEFGGRITDVNGNGRMYNTLVNYQSGPRLLDQSLTVQSLTHEDMFDTLTLSSFGWGGDPEQAARLRIAKYGWYNFTGSYQHMQNFFDYDLFANPLNPPTGSPSVPVLNSPHSYDNRQNLYNFGLVLLPMKRISFRLDFNRNRIIGPAFSSVHQGTDALTNQLWNNQLNGFRFGADLRLSKKTTLSYTQLLQYYTGGTTYDLNPFNSWTLPNGQQRQQVSFGLSWFNGGSPCTTPLRNGLANPVCNGYFDYTLFQHEHTYIPTEQLNLRSSRKWLDFNGQYQYSHARSSSPLTETYRGLTTRTVELGYTTASSSSRSRWNSSSANVSATIHLSDRLRLVESLRFRTFSVAGDFLDLESAFFTAAGGTASLLSSIASFPPTILLHNPSSPADILNQSTINLIGQNTKLNDFQVQYDLTSHVGVRAGFIWDRAIIQPGNTFEAALGDIYYPNNPNRGNCVGVPLNPDGSCTFTGVLAPWGSPTTEINRYSGVVGAWLRTAGGLHADVDAQVGGADNWLYRIDPLHFFNIRANARYAPRPWLMLGGNVVFHRATNHDSDLAFSAHNYSVAANATITPNKRWGLDLAYNFDAIQQNTNLCFAATPAPAGSFTCLGDPTLLESYGLYETHTQYGSFAVMLSPLERVTVRAGYNVVDNQGNTTSLNPLLPLGPLNSRYQSPLAGVDVALQKNVTFRAGWNYYQYAEGSFVGPAAPRYFHANDTTLALRYAF